MADMAFGAPHPDQDLWDWLSRRLVRYIPVDLNNANKLLIAGPALFKGGSFKETSGSQTQVVLRDNNDAAATRVLTQSIAANGGQFLPTPYWGVLCRGGILLSTAPGHVVGGVWVAY